MKIRVSWICPLICGASLTGCVEPAPAPTSAGASATDASSAIVSPAAALRNRLTNSDNGLEVRRLVVNDQPGLIMAALSKRADGGAVADPILQRLKQNGFRFVRLPEDQVENFITDLGGASYDAHEWNGQVTEWRSLVDRPIDDAGVAVAIDGIVSRYAGGDFRLMMRSWTVQMEDGTVVHLEMLPRRRGPQTTDLRRLLGSETRSEQGFSSMAIDLQLQPGFAYVLLCESPQNDWPGLDGSAPTAPASTAAKPAKPPRTGPFDMIGPEAAAPPTLGELLLAVHRDPPAKGLLVLIPKISPQLLPPDRAASPSP